MAEREKSDLEKKITGAIDECVGATGRLVCLQFFFLVILTLVGTIFLMAVEDFEAIDAVYWTVATFTTVGYGDLSLSDRHGTRWFFIVYIFISVSAFASIIGGFAAVYIQYERAGLLHAVLSKGVTPAMIKAMDVNGDDEIQRDEFLCFMLVKLHKCDAQTLNEINAMFDSVDHEG